MEHDVSINKVPARTAYPKNGNLHNPTVTYRWEATVDGKVVTGHARTKREAQEIVAEYLKGK